jgi:hypothetical protein
MYLAVVFLIFDQASILGNVVLFGYGMLVWLACHVFVLAYEEPILWKTFWHRVRRLLCQCASMEAPDEPGARTTKGDFRALTGGRRELLSWRRSWQR